MARHVMHLVAALAAYLTAVSAAAARPPHISTPHARSATAALPLHRLLLNARPNRPWAVIPRGGSTAVLNPPGDRVDVDEDEEEEEARRTKRAEDEERRKLSKFRSDQQVLLQLRSTFLTEALAKRGLPVATVAGVSTADGDRPPEATDWECALSTHDDPKVRRRHGKGNSEGWPLFPPHLQRLL